MIPAGCFNVKAFLNVLSSTICEALGASESQRCLRELIDEKEAAAPMELGREISQLINVFKQIVEEISKWLKRKVIISDKIDCDVGKLLEAIQKLLTDMHINEASVSYKIQEAIIAARNTGRTQYPILYIAQQLVDFIVSLELPSGPLVAWMDDIDV